MIKIVRPGTKKLAVCDFCGCQFTYEAEDIRTQPLDPLGLHISREYVLCPQCHKEKILLATK